MLVVPLRLEPGRIILLTNSHIFSVLDFRLGNVSYISLENWLKFRKD